MYMFDLPFDQFDRFFIVFVRITAIMASLPFLGSRNILMRTKVGFSLFISVVIFSLIDFSQVLIPTDVLSFSLLLCGEILIGIIIGYATRLFFLAVQMAGHLIGFQIGFGIVNVMDPQTNSQISVIAQFENIIAMLFFLSTNAHYIFLKAMADSFNLISPLGFTFSPDIVTIIVDLFTDIFALSLRISAPVLASLIFTHVALGLIARTVPQINVFIVGFPLQIGIGLFMIGVTISFFNVTLKDLFMDMNSHIYLLLRAM